MPQTAVSMAYVCELLAAMEPSKETELFEPFLLIQCGVGWVTL